MNNIIVEQHWEHTTGNIGLINYINKNINKDFFHITNSVMYQKLLEREIIMWFLLDIFIFGVHLSFTLIQCTYARLFFFMMHISGHIEWNSNTYISNVVSKTLKHRVMRQIHLRMQNRKKSSSLCSRKRRGEVLEK